MFQKKANRGDYSFQIIKGIVILYLIKEAWNSIWIVQLDQWNKLESPKIDPNTYGKVAFQSSEKNDGLFNKWLQDSWVPAGAIPYCSHQSQFHMDERTFKNIKVQKKTRTFFFFFKNHLQVGKIFLRHKIQKP